MNKKLVVLIIFLVLIILLYIFVMFIPKNYSTEYQIDSYDIKESFDKKNKLYTFEIINKDNSYKYFVAGKYSTKRHLIKEIEREDTCLTASLKKLDSFTICKQDGAYYTSYVNDTFDDAKQKEEYENIKIYDLLDKSYLIWNYTDFIGINNKKKEKIKLFQNDIYTLDMAYQYDDYLILPDYDSKYTFKKIYFINSKKFKYDDLTLDRDIYFNSYILGDYKKHLYLYDLQAENEYVIDLKKGIVEKYKYGVLVNNKWEEVSKNKLSKKNIFFHSDEQFSYLLEDETLYFVNPEDKIKVTNMKVSNLISYHDKEAYFISKDSLYYVHLDEGITKLLSNSEWEFNNKNIYIF